MGNSRGRAFTFRRALISSTLQHRQTESSIFSTQQEFRPRSQSLRRENSTSNLSNLSDSWSNLLVGQTTCRLKSTSSNSRLSSSVENLCASNFRASSENVSVERTCYVENTSSKREPMTQQKIYCRQNSRGNKRNVLSSNGKINR